MILLDGNSTTPEFYFLPDYPIGQDLQIITFFTLRLIDDETQKVTTYNNNFNVENDFVKYSDSSLALLGNEKYYTMTVELSSSNKIVYRDKIFKTTQSAGIKYNNNTNQFVEADSGNNDYIIL